MVGQVRFDKDKDKSNKKSKVSAKDKEKAKAAFGALTANGVSGVFPDRPYGTFSTRTGLGLGADTAPQTRSITKSPSFSGNRAGLAKSRSAVMPKTPEPEPELPSFGKTLADYLGQASQIAGSGIAEQLAALAASKQTAQSSAAAGDSKLAAMYQALQNVTGQDNSAAQARYQKAQEDSAALTAGNQAALTGANTAVRQDQDQTLANLGIAGANKNAAVTQDEAARVANSQNQAIGNAAGQNIIAGGLNQGNYGAAMGTAAQFAGASRRSELQSALQKALTDISQSEARLRDSASQQSTQLAGQMYGSDYDQWRDQRDFGAGRDDEAWRRGQAEFEGANQNAMDPSKLMGSDAILYSLQQSGVPAASQQGIMKLIQAGLANSNGGKANIKGQVVSPFAAIHQQIQAALDAGQITPADASKALQAASSTRLSL